MENYFASERRLWLISRRADFWLVGSGASAALLAAGLFIVWHGDRELDWLDFVLSEFHLGATYHAVIRRRLWRYSPVDVLIVPFVILVLTYALSINGQAVLLTSIAMYAAVWHRGRQSFGVARFYQRQVGGPMSRTHEVLFCGAIYLSMLAGLVAYTHLAPMEYEGDPYLALSFGKEMTSAIGFAASLWVISYLVWIYPKSHDERPSAANQTGALRIHPGEWWVVLAHAVAFGSGYVLGASKSSFLLVLAVHHEVQYLYFTYAMARRPGRFHAGNTASINRAMKDLDSRASREDGGALPTELKHATSFLMWPVIGFLGAVASSWFDLNWLAPLGAGGLFCHYWLDGRIWTRQSLQN